MEDSWRMTAEVDLCLPHAGTCMCTRIHTHTHTWTFIEFTQCIFWLCSLRSGQESLTFSHVPDDNDVVDQRAVLEAARVQSWLFLSPAPTASLGSSSAHFKPNPTFWIGNSGYVAQRVIGEQRFQVILVCILKPQGLCPQCASCSLVCRLEGVSNSNSSNCMDLLCTTLMLWNL